MYIVILAIYIIFTIIFSFSLILLFKHFKCRIDTSISITRESSDCIGQHCGRLMPMAATPSSLLQIQIQGVGEVERARMRLEMLICHVPIVILHLSIHLPPHIPLPQEPGNVTHAYRVYWTAVFKTRINSNFITH